MGRRFNRGLRKQRNNSTWRSLDYIQLYAVIDQAELICHRVMKSMNESEAEDEKEKGTGTLSGELWGIIVGEVQSKKRRNKKKKNQLYALSRRQESLWAAWQSITCMCRRSKATVINICHCLIVQSWKRPKVVSPRRKKKQGNKEGGLVAPLGSSSRRKRLFNPSFFSVQLNMMVVVRPVCSPHEPWDMLGSTTGAGQLFFCYSQQRKSFTILPPWKCKKNIGPSSHQSKWRLNWTGADRIAQGKRYKS